jgi:hypothetical protein
MLQHICPGNFWYFLISRPALLQPTAPPDDVMHSICDPELPNAGEVWRGVVENVDQWWGVQH